MRTYDNEIPFYKKDANSSIDNIKIKYLLEATPFKTGTQYNFSKRLTEAFFFDRFYSEKWMPSDNKEICEKNSAFEELIENELLSMENPHEKISLFHLWGYAGCGKTTFIRHLLWQLSKEKGITYKVINFEKCTRISSALETTIKRLTEKNDDDIVSYLNQVSNQELFDLGAFEMVFSFIKAFSVYAKEYNELKISENIDIPRILSRVKGNIEEQFNKPTIELENVDNTATPYSTYISFLITLLFFITLHRMIIEDKSNMVILLDNVDSIRNLNEEYILLTTIMDFLNACDLFIEQNIDCDRTVKGTKISTLIDNMKYSLFLTTRVVTAKRFRELKPDYEDAFGWDNHEMPEFFYNHEDILDKRIQYYRSAENNRTDSKVLNKINGVNELAKNMYRSKSFRKLFNGNIRFCFSTLCYIYDKFYMTPLMEDCKELNNEYDCGNSFAGVGANGIVLAMILSYFKEKDVYSKKLHLSTCSQDDTISLSRVILTILHEYDGSCSILDIFNALPPKYVNEKLCEYIWDLSELERDVWRRLLAFERKIPETEDELERQYNLFLNNERRRTVYTEILLCRSGEVFLEIVIPHFEFMFSRCVKKDYLSNKFTFPLFSSHSLETYNSNGKSKFIFEYKIGKVYKTVRECALNSRFFAKEVIEHFNYDANTFLNSSKLNYHDEDKAGIEGSYQSYIGRLIFGHIGYIEVYRMYLKNSKKLTPDINRKLTTWISKYLNLYKNADPILHSTRQDSAMNDMLRSVQIIRNSGYTDYSTRIMTSSLQKR